LGGQKRGLCPHKRSRYYSGETWEEGTNIEPCFALFAPGGLEKKKRKNRHAEDHADTDLPPEMRQKRIISKRQRALRKRAEKACARNHRILGEMQKTSKNTEEGLKEICAAAEPRRRVALKERGGNDKKGRNKEQDTV